MNFNQEIRRNIPSTFGSSLNDLKFVFRVIFLEISAVKVHLPFGESSDRAPRRPDRSHRWCPLGSTDSIRPWRRRVNAGKYQNTTRRSVGLKTVLFHMEDLLTQ